jgi:protein SCO1/2
MSAPDRPPRARLSRLTVAMLLLAGVLGVAAGAYLLGVPRGAPSAPPLATVLDAPRPLPEFSLVAHDGSRFDRARLTGHYTLLFLGFTRCQDVCPATLAVLAATRRALAGLPAARRPRVVMVSVDPAHDTPAALAAFVPRFDPEFVGVGGADAALRPLAAALGAYYSPGPADGTGGAMHSGAVFLIDPAARLAAVYTTLPAPTLLAADYVRLTRARGGPS